MFREEPKDTLSNRAATRLSSSAGRAKIHSQRRSRCFAPIVKEKPKHCKPIDLVLLVLAPADDFLGHSEKGLKKCQTTYEAAGLYDSAERYGSTITLAVFQMPVR